MQIIDRYIGRAIFSSSLVVLVGLVGIFLFLGFLDELDSLGQGRYTIFAAGEFTLLSAPRIAYEAFPIAALLGCLLALGNMVSNRELPVIRAAGVTVWRLIGSVLRGGVLVIVMAVVLGELITPYTEPVARNRRTAALSGQDALRSENGFWTRNGNSFINIRGVIPGEGVEDLYIYEFDANDQLRLSTFAERADYRDGEWLLHGIRQTEIGADGAVTVNTFDRANWTSLLAPDLVSMIEVKPQSLSSYDLVRYIRYLRRNQQMSVQYEQALWTKLVYPLATASMILLSVPLVLLLPHWITVGQRVVFGAFIGMTFHIINQAVTNLGVVYGFSPVLSAFSPTAAILAIATLLLLRMEWRFRPD